MLAPLAGVVVATLGHTWAFWIRAAGYLMSALALRGLRLPAVQAEEFRKRYASARNGLVAIAGHRLLRGLAVAQFLAALSAGATGARLSCRPTSTCLWAPRSPVSAPSTTRGAALLLAAAAAGWAGLRSTDT